MKRERQRDERPELEPDVKEDEAEPIESAAAAAR